MTIIKEEFTEWDRRNYYHKMYEKIYRKNNKVIKITFDDSGRYGINSYMWTDKHGWVHVYYLNTASIERTIKRMVDDCEHINDDIEFTQEMYQPYIKTITDITEQILVTLN